MSNKTFNNTKINVEFDEDYQSRTNINSGENISSLFAKIRRFILDLKAVAFSGSYNDLSDKPTAATKDTDGLMSAEDKGKLDNADNTYALKSKYGDTIINVGRKAGTIVGHFSTAEGQATTASSLCSHAEGDQTTASGNFSHSEGEKTKAIGAYSHAEGCVTEANGIASHAEGRETTAFGDYSHTSGYYTKALHDNEAAYGKYNESNDNTLFSIGDGTADDARHNAFEITTDGGKLHDKDIVTDDMSLPANGGNADTVDGLHADDFVKSVNPRITGDIVFENPSNQNTINAIYSANDSLVFRNISKDGSSVCDLLIGNDGVRIANATQNFIIGNGGNADYADNADKLDGLHATDFAMARNSDLMTLLNGQSGDIRALVHQLSCGGYIFDTNYPQLKDVTFPISGAAILSWFPGIFNANNFIYGILIIRPMTSTGDTYICSVYNTTQYTEWQKIYSGLPYVTGTVTVAANSTTAITEHNFMPSAVLYSGLGGVQFATSATTTSFDLADGSTLARTIKYIIFR